LELKTDFEPLIAPRDASKLLDIHPKSLTRMAREGRIPAVRVGKKWRFRVSSIDRWLSDRLESNCQSDQSVEIQ
jgi:excisionase family DNA binding protein